MRSTKPFLALLLVFITLPAMALPIDWGGSLGFDDTLINNIRLSKDDVTKANGTQGISTGDDGAHFQTYILKLNPHMIVNDSVSVKGELSTGYARGGFSGDNTTQAQNGSTAGSNSYYSTVPAQRSALNVNQLYAELYADTALIKVGRFSKEFGTGAILNSGKNTFDRFFTLYDGLQGEMRIGNFVLTPHWVRLGTTDTSNKAQPNGSSDSREMGLVATYDNKATNLIVALAYTSRFSEGKNGLYLSSTGFSTSSAAGTTVARGKTDVTLIDAYLAKKWEKFNLSIEVPTMSGTYGNVYGNGSSKVSASSALAEVVWSPNAKWDYGMHIGQVGGDRGDSQNFEAMQLNPNYQIAELMFHYNYNAFNEANGKSIFDRGLTNVRFYKLHAHYKTDKWTWNAAAIIAKAVQTAKTGKKAYQHEEGYRFDANANQSDNYGTEVDLGFDYQWNPNVKLSGYLGYWMVGDYYAFTNTSSTLGVSNVLGSGLRLGIDF
ncbi:MAG: hypothetical protein K2P81_04315 [Bacteriovoracaceae bacterium]|nr:hypothetical protein [Bacteriovoracaceae bacterium]